MQTTRHTIVDRAIHSTSRFSWRDVRARYHDERPIGQLPTKPFIFPSATSIQCYSKFLILSNTTLKRNILIFYFSTRLKIGSKFFISSYRSLGAIHPCCWGKIRLDFESVRSRDRRFLIFVIKVLKDTEDGWTLEILKVVVGEKINGVDWNF